jgi:hypothetical protein
MMKDGEIEEMGTYDELMSKDGSITQLVNEYDPESQRADETGQPSAVEFHRAGPESHHDGPQSLRSVFLAIWQRTFWRMKVYTNILLT